MIKLSVAIPVYKEAENLKVLLPRLVTVLEKIEPFHEIVIIDTMSAMDDTKSVCESVAGNVKYFNRSNGNSFGDAVRTGIEKAAGEFIVFMDGDGSHDPEFIENLYQERLESDVVIASRYVDGGSTENSRVLILLSLIINVTYSLVLNLDCKDVSNSFKLYKLSDLKNITLRSSNFEIIEEILYKLKKNNPQIKIKELPFTFKKRRFGETKRNLFSFAVSYLVTLVKLRFS